MQSGEKECLSDCSAKCSRWAFGFGKGLSMKKGLSSCLRLRCRDASAFGIVPFGTV